MKAEHLDTSPDLSGKPGLSEIWPEATAGGEKASFRQDDFTGLGFSILNLLRDERLKMRCPSLP